jgi:hypothetical protein
MGNSPSRPNPYMESGREHVYEHAHAHCPTCDTLCRVEKILWYDRHLGTQSRLSYIPVVVPLEGNEKT